LLTSCLTLKKPKAYADQTGGQALSLHTSYDISDLSGLSIAYWLGLGLRYEGQH